MDELDSKLDPILKRLDAQDKALADLKLQQEKAASAQKLDWIKWLVMGGVAGVGMYFKVDMAALLPIIGLIGAGVSKMADAVPGKAGG